MNWKNTPALGAVLALALATAGTARADYFYNFSPTDFPTVYSDHSGMGINLINQTQIGPISTGHDTNVVAVTLSTFINPGITGSDTFTTGQHSTVSVTITDGTAHASTNFGLLFTGSLSASTSGISVAFDGPSSKPLTVNNHQYTITLDSIVPPGVPGAISGSVGGRILAGIQVGPPGGGPPSGGPPQNAPEPSTLVLSALGAAGGLFGGFRRWRLRKA
jgi:hypothetical protein